VIRVRLVVPSPALRAGLRSLLAADSGISVVEELSAWNANAETAEAADVVITTSAASEIPIDRFAQASLLVAVLFLRDEPLDIRSLLGLSLVWGILPLDASAVTLCAAVRALAAGLVVGSAALMATSAQEHGSRGPLTEREAEVLSLLSKGLANKQIAMMLGISEHTVKFHVSSIYTKLDATSRTQAVREGLRNGWIVL
jgi:DNA-binding NarL/FixJ family response regulator